MFCGKTKGKSAGHKWKDATFSTPKTCEVCGKEDGDPLNAPIGDGYIDYVVLDVDDDGEDELVEVYGSSESFSSYRIYNSDSDYYDMNVESWAIAPSDYIIYNNNTGSTSACWYGAGMHGWSLYDSYGNYICGIDQRRDDTAEYSWGENVYYIGTKEVSEKKFKSYIDNLSIIYSYRDPNGASFYMP